MKRNFALPVFALMLAMFAATLPAQTRMSDRDVEHMMHNLSQDARTFRSSYSSAINHSTIRHTSQARDAQQQAKTFVEQTKGLYDIFRHHKKAGDALSTVLDSAGKIEGQMAGLDLGPKVASDWARIRSELDALAQAYNLAPMAPPPAR